MKEVFFGFYKEGNKSTMLARVEEPRGFWRETTMKNELVSVSEYNEDQTLKNGRCFLF